MFMEAEIKQRYKKEYSNWQQAKELNNKLQKENDELKNERDSLVHSYSKQDAVWRAEKDKLLKLLAEERSKSIIHIGK